MSMSVSMPLSVPVSMYLSVSGSMPMSMSLLMYHPESNDPTPDHVYNKLCLENFATLLALTLKLTDLVQTLCELA